MNSRFMLARLEYGCQLSVWYNMDRSDQYYFRQLTDLSIEVAVTGNEQTNMLPPSKTFYTYLLALFSLAALISVNASIEARENRGIMFQQLNSCWSIVFTFNMSAVVSESIQGRILYSMQMHEKHVSNKISVTSLLIMTQTLAFPNLWGSKLKYF